MKPIAVITHVDQADVGLLIEISRERGQPSQTIRPYRGEQLPDLADVGAVVTMGGPQSAYEEHQYLRQEEHYLAAAVEAEVPVLGICLGAQVLSRALGGAAQPGESGLEAGLIQVKPTEAGRTELTGEFFSFHSDSMTPPGAAEVLATSARYVQAWTSGSALAVQFHPEITLRGIDSLLSIEGPKLQRYGIDVAGMRGEAEQYFADGATDSRALLAGWLSRIPAESMNT
jgi:GMP synthase (glutamine-hydrolysing)